MSPADPAEVSRGARLAASSHTTPTTLSAEEATYWPTKIKNELRSKNRALCSDLCGHVHDYTPQPQRAGSGVPRPGELRQRGAQRESTAPALPRKTRLTNACYLDGGDWRIRRIQHGLTKPPARSDETGSNTLHRRRARCSTLSKLTKSSFYSSFFCSTPAAFLLGTTLPLSCTAASADPSAIAGRAEPATALRITFHTRPITHVNGTCRSMGSK